MTVTIGNHRPRNIDVDRAAGTVTITWADFHHSVFDAAWLRANCPCATCREERWEAVHGDQLRLTDAPPPSSELTGAELVGGYAIQLQWADGHGAGIYTFSALRRCCPCEKCNPEGEPFDLG